MIDEGVDRELDAERAAHEPHLAHPPGLGAVDSPRVPTTSAQRAHRHVPLGGGVTCSEEYATAPVGAARCTVSPKWLKDQVTV